MREFIFKERYGKQQNFSVLVDIIDPNTQLMTIMEFKGNENGSFFSVFPYVLGSVLTKNDLLVWFNKFNGMFEGTLYWGGGSYSEDLVSDSQRKTLTITPEILNGDKTNIKITTLNSDGFELGSFVESIENDETLEIPIIVGTTYKFDVIGNDVWTSGSAPDSITCDGDETLTASITIPNDSKIYKLTLTPTLVGIEKATVKITGTKSGYANDIVEIELASTAVEQNVYDGYVYSYSIVTTDCVWTSGDAPDNTEIDGANASVNIGITYDGE